jgi:hypothetical protein
MCTLITSKGTDIDENIANQNHATRTRTPKPEYLNLSIGLHRNELNEKDKRTCNFVQKKIHKLPFGVPRGTKAFQISDLQAIVDNFYREIQIDSNSTIAFKGGHYERDLLASLRIPAVNLECFKCPKAEKIFDQLIRLETCGNHLESDAYQHCAKVEAFAMWLQQ